MVLVFIAFGIVALRQFIAETGTEIHSAADLWNLPRRIIWKGGDPLPGQVKFTFWHVMFFAWFCNMAMHIGMGDLSVFRFARKSWYAIASGAGMFLGHFIAWLAASILYALQLARDPANTDVLPGPLAYNACGIAGLICVDRRRLDHGQPDHLPRRPRLPGHLPRVVAVKVTLFTGARGHGRRHVPGLRDEAARFRRALRPGADADGRRDLRRLLAAPQTRPAVDYAEVSRTRFNWAAGLTWFLTLAACWALSATTATTDLLRRAAGLVRRRRALPRPQQTLSTKGARMRPLLQLISFAALVATIVPPILFLVDRI